MHRKSMADAGRRKGRKSGFVLVRMAVAAIAPIGILGLAVDLGHSFISKNETQAYCDSAALAAALALDGTTAGTTNAKAAVTNSTNGWNFSTASISSPTITFATALAGPWQSNPSPATGYSFAKVSARVPMQLYFGASRPNRRECQFERQCGASRPSVDSNRPGTLHGSQHQYNWTESWTGGRELLRSALAAIQLSSRRLRPSHSRQMFRFATVYRGYKRVLDSSRLKLGS